jgi:hypothetical protein
MRPPQTSQTGMPPSKDGEDVGARVIRRSAIAEERSSASFDGSADWTRGDPPQRTGTGAIERDLPVVGPLELRDLMQLLRAHFRPEFLNRIDEIIVFRSLTREQVVDITRLLLDGVTRRLTRSGSSCGSTTRPSATSPMRGSIRSSAPGRCSARSSD